MNPKHTLKLIERIMSIEINPNQILIPLDVTNI